jgi:hypothetical protein
MAELQVLIRWQWIYLVLSAAVGAMIAYAQGYASIVLAFWALIYTAVILFIIMFYRWELHLPIKIIELPDCRF